MDVEKLIDGAGKQKKKVRSTYFFSDASPKLAEKLNALANEVAAKEAIYAAIANEVVYYLKLHGQFYKRKYGSFRDALYLYQDCKALYDIHHDSFCALLSRLTGINRSSKIYEYVFSAIENTSIGDEVVSVEPKSYWHVTDQATYITYKPGQIVRIDRNGLRIVDNGTDNVIFPQHCFIENWDLVEAYSDPFKTLWIFKNGSFEHSWGLQLLKLWFLSIFCLPAGITRPILTLCGINRSGKTALIRSVMEMLGLPDLPMGLDERGKTEETFWLKLDKGGILCLDNIDERVPWIANALCCAASGDTTSRRTLFTDKSETIFFPNAWIALTTINPVFASNPAVSDRMLVVRMKHRTDDMSSWDGRLHAQIKNCRNSIMSWLVNTIKRFYVTPLSQCDTIKRNPSFSAIAMTIANVIGEGDKSEHAIRESEFFKKVFNLANSRLGQMLVLLSRRRWKEQPFEGDAQALLATLLEYDKSFSSMSVQELTEEIKQLKPNLSQHLLLSIGGAKDNPIYRLCGCRESPEQYIDEQVPDIDEVASRIEQTSWKDKEGNPYLI
jgi:hypothetical protein